MITDYLAPVFTGFLKVMAVIVLFFLLMTLVRLLANLVGRTFRLPILGQIDGLLGGVFGFLLALLAVWIVVAAVTVVMPILDTATRYQVDQALDQSVIAGLFMQANPLKGMFT